MTPARSGGPASGPPLRLLAAGCGIALAIALLDPLWLRAQDPAGPVYSGRQGDVTVQVPRVEEPEVVLDGHLDEPAWERAAVLTGFTQYEPSEGAPATERTEVLVFYSAEAIYVAVRAHARDPGRIRATLADRGNILGDDHVQILLDTFGERRKAYALHINPLGVQQDGMLDEGARRPPGRPIDFSPDYHFSSRGRLTPEGYVVEARIPFGSLRIPSAEPQRWGFNVVRFIAATGVSESWAPLVRSPSILAQSGTLEGLADLRPDRLVEVTPVLTARSDRALRDGVLERAAPEADIGLDAKYGLTRELVLDLTVNPDFSQIEADAGQITVNERFDIFFPEMRPFFLEGTELFSTPEQLVHTRTIVSPVAGVKGTGRAAGMEVGYLAALDDSPITGVTGTLAPQPSRALFNLLRLQHNLDADRSFGLLVTDRRTRDESNLVTAIDGRLRFGGSYTARAQVAGSRTEHWIAGETGSAELATERGHLLSASLDRTARRWGFFARLTDHPATFRALSGFLPRRGYSQLFLANRLRFFGPDGATLQSAGPFIRAEWIWDGRDLWQAGRPSEGLASLRFDLSFAGNTRVVTSYSNRFHLLDPARYGHLRYVDGEGSERSGRELIEPIRHLAGMHGASVELSSDYLDALSFSVGAGVQETPIFAEGVRGVERSVEGEVTFRPTGSLRLHGAVVHALLDRGQDGSRYSVATVPRVRLEYQLARPLFVRLMGQYLREEVDLLRAPDGTPYTDGGAPFRLRSGERIPADAVQRHPVLGEFLLSYRPVPGTVFFLGYSREMTDDAAFRFTPMEPRRDGFFLKASYLFRP